MNDPYRLFPLLNLVRLFKWVKNKFKRKKIKVFMPKGFDPSQNIYAQGYLDTHEIIVEE